MIFSFEFLCHIILTNILSGEKIGCLPEFLIGSGVRSMISFFNEKISLQVAPSFSYYNNVEAFYTDANVIQPKTNNGHFSISAAGRYKLTDGMSIIANYDQPITQHPMNNPNPNIAIGLDMKTSGHDFQIFFGNYGYVLPQTNNVFNHNDFTKSQFLIGFNISRLWNF
jgi:hypothetical protein